MLRATLMRTWRGGYIHDCNVMHTIIRRESPGEIPFLRPSECSNLYVSGVRELPLVLWLADRTCSFPSTPEVIMKGDVIRVSLLKNTSTNSTFLLLRKDKYFICLSYCKDSHFYVNFRQVLTSRYTYAKLVSIRN